MAEDIICKRCGKCCKIFIDGKPSDLDCMYLIRFKSGRTLCRIYNERLGKKLQHNNVCIMREQSRFDYEGCPYNNGKRAKWEEIKKQVEKMEAELNGKEKTY